jgi:putative transposase
VEVSYARRLKTLEDENRKLKRLLADSLLDKAALKDLEQRLGLSGRAERSPSSSTISNL